MCNLVSDWIGSTGGNSEDALMDTLRELVESRFDSQKADQVFSVQKSGAPSWLDLMTKDSKWRAVLYRLSEQHPSCLLLNFALQVCCFS